MPEETMQESLWKAAGHHQAGRLGEAEKLYRQLLEREPNHPHLLHLLGVVLGQEGRQESAVEFIRRAIRILPDSADFHHNLGVALRSGPPAAQALRVPRGSQSAAEAGETWIRFLLSRLDGATPILALLPLRASWVDLIVGEPTASQLYCLRAGSDVLPLTSSIPYEIPAEVPERIERLI